MYCVIGAWVRLGLAPGRMLRLLSHGNEHGNLSVKFICSPLQGASMCVCGSSALEQCRTLRHPNASSHQCRNSKLPSHSLTPLYLLWAFRLLNTDHRGRAENHNNTTGHHRTPQDTTTLDNRNITTLRTPQSHFT